MGPLTYRVCYATAKTLQISQHTTILLTETRHLGGTIPITANSRKQKRYFVVMFNIINIIITKNNQHYI